MIKQDKNCFIQTNPALIDPEAEKNKSDSDQSMAAKSACRSCPWSRDVGELGPEAAGSHGGQAAGVRQTDRRL